MLGKLINKQGKRDAVHVAIAPVQSSTVMRPGDWVAISPSGLGVPSDHVHAIGVVDPFLQDGPKGGEWFWLFVKPGTITNLRHEWSHHEFGGTSEERAKHAAAVRLAEFAKVLNVSLEDMLEHIDSCRHGGDPLMSWGYEGLEIPAGFWEAYECFTGKLDPNKDGYFYFFTCGGCS